MDNGILQVDLSKPCGFITGIQYNGIDNLLEVHTGEDDRGWRMSFNCFFYLIIFSLYSCDHK